MPGEELSASSLAARGLGVTSGELLGELFGVLAGGVWLAFFEGVMAEVAPI